MAEEPEYKFLNDAVDIETSEQWCLMACLMTDPNSHTMFCVGPFVWTLKLLPTSPWSHLLVPKKIWADKGHNYVGTIGRTEESLAGGQTANSARHLNDNNEIGSSCMFVYICITWVSNDWSVNSVTETAAFSSSLPIQYYLGTSHLTVSGTHKRMKGNEKRHNGFLLLTAQASGLRSGLKTENPTMV